MNRAREWLQVASFPVPSPAFVACSTVATASDGHGTGNEVRLEPGNQ